MTKNVLFIGPYRQGLDGWNIASREYIRALIKTGVNLTIRPVYMGPGISDPPVEFLEYEENKLPYYDVVIQNVLPHLVDYNSKLGKNIALFYTETSRWNNVWVSRLNTMDEIWVPSHSDMFNLCDSGIDKNRVAINRVPIPVDTKKFEQSYESQDLKPLEQIPGFKFYFVGELIQRKSLDKLIQAFHLEFDVTEEVQLVVKTNRAGASPDQVAKLFNEYVTSIKNKLRIYRDDLCYKKEIVITDKLSENNLYYLHSKCDCFVMPSMGESWSMPVIDALGFGNTPIVIENTGPNSVVDPYNGWIVPSYLDNVLVTDAPLPDIYTGREVWHNYSILNLRSAMRQAFECNQIRNIKREKAIETVYELSYDRIAETIKDIL